MNRHTIGPHVRARRRHLAQDLGRDQDHHLLHVRLPLRDQSLSQGRHRQIYRRQSRSPRKQGRDLRQGCGRHHAALFARKAVEAADPGGRARFRRIPRNRVGRGTAHRDPVALRNPQHRSQEARLLHRPRPEPGPHRLVGGAIWNAKLCRPWRLLFGQHGRRRALHLRRLLLGVRRARLEIHQILFALRRGRRPCLQSDQGGPRQAEGQGRQVRLGQSHPHRLFGHRR